MLTNPACVSVIKVYFLAYFFHAIRMYEMFGLLHELLVINFFTREAEGVFLAKDEILIQRAYEFFSIDIKHHLVLLYRKCLQNIFTVVENSGNNTESHLSVRFYISFLEWGHVNIKK